MSSNLILLYRGFYAEAYLLDVVSRYDIHGKKIFQSNEKIFWDDLGLRNLKAEDGMDSYTFLCESFSKKASYYEVINKRYKARGDILTDIPSPF